MLLDFLKKEKAKQNSDSNVAEDFFPFKIKKNTSKNKQTNKKPHKNETKQKATAEIFRSHLKVKFF